MVPAFAAGVGAPELLIVVLILVLLFLPVVVLVGAGYLLVTRRNGEGASVEELESEVSRLRERVEELEGDGGE